MLAVMGEACATLALNNAPQSSWYILHTACVKCSLDTAMLSQAGIGLRLWTRFGVCVCVCPSSQLELADMMSLDDDIMAVQVWLIPQDAIHYLSLIPLSFYLSPSSTPSLFYISSTSLTHSPLSSLSLSSSLLNRKTSYDFHFLRSRFNSSVHCTAKITNEAFVHRVTYHMSLSLSL